MELAEQGVATDLANLYLFLVLKPQVILVRREHGRQQPGRLRDEAGLLDQDRYIVVFPILEQRLYFFIQSHKKRRD